MELDIHISRDSERRGLRLTMIYMRGVVVCELGRTRDMVELDYSDFNSRDGYILARVPIN